MKLKVTYGSLPAVEGVCVVQSSSACARMVRELLDADVVGVDTETTSLDLSTYHPIGKVKILTAQFATREKAWFVPLYGRYAQNFAPLREFIESDRKNKTLHNFKYDAFAFYNHGIRMRGLLGDTMVMDFLWDSAAMSHSLKECMRRYFGLEEAIDYKDTFSVPQLKKNGEPTKSSMRLPSLEEVIQTDEGLRKLIDYSVKDPKFTVQLYDYLAGKLKKIPWKKTGENYLEFYETFDRPYTEVLFDMERRGCTLDTEHLSKIDGELSVDVDKIRGKFIRACVGSGVPQDFIAEFNMASPKQVARLIQDYLGVKITERTEKGAPSTDDASLRKLRTRGPAKEIIELLLEMRRVTKFQGTYVQPLLHYADEYGGKVHTGFRQIGTGTSRLSSGNPNIQNLPASGKDHYGIRSAFVAPEGMVIGDIDLSQIEIRLMAHLSQDEELLRCLRLDWDIHSLTATRTSPIVIDWMKENNKELCAETLHEVQKLFKDERAKAKTINFGAGYGMGPTKYAEMTGQTEKEGKAVIHAFFSAYHGLKRHIAVTQKYCYDKGYVRTFAGRYLRIPNIRSQNEGLRRYAERQAFNYIVQGGCAELLRMSMILIHNSQELKDLGVEMVLQVHDELVFNVPKGAEEVAAPIIEELVSHPLKYFGMDELSVDTPGEIGFGKSWGEAKK